MTVSGSGQKQAGTLAYTWNMTTYSAVVTTGIYCRPGCSAKPLTKNCKTFDHPAAAEAAGFRACYRCRPYRVAAPAPASASELVCEAVQQIIGGALDDGGTEEMLAAGFGLSAALRCGCRSCLAMTGTRCGGGARRALTCPTGRG